VDCNESAVEKQADESRIFEGSVHRFGLQLPPPDPSIGWSRVGSARLVYRGLPIAVLEILYFKILSGIGVGSDLSAAELCLFC
jgi:hypothetical protein